MRPNKYRQLLEKARTLVDVITDYDVKADAAGDRFADLEHAIALGVVWANARDAVIYLEEELAKLGFHPRASHEHLEAVSIPDATHGAILSLRAWLIDMRHRNVAGWGNSLPRGTVWVTEVGDFLLAPVPVGDRVKRLAAIVQQLAKGIDPDAANGQSVASMAPAAKSTKGKYINARMLEEIQKNLSEVSGFTAAQWAERLHCSPSTICAAKVWKDLTMGRKRQRAERARDRRRNRTK